MERGRDGSVSLAPPCAYIGNRLGRRSGTGPDFGVPVQPPEIAIVDVRDPRKPHVVGHLRTPPGGTTRELRAIPELNTLYVMNFEESSAETGAAVNNFMVYDITDCRRPVLRNTIDFGQWEPHEFFVWRDRNTANRVLVYFSASGSEPWMRVYDVTNAVSGQSPRQAATFTMHPVLPSSQPIDPADRCSPPGCCQRTCPSTASRADPGTRR